ncbi:MULTISPECIES: DeoR/GlpR family DNA-binding transcription regulator [Pseudoxanthomonas]|jgi:DeoR/GlpR family transcriptional regulator of sugar metabolism|uniref:DeoR/GlpR transcriptional regulator n=1 Tax=Pseudoxanthomonas winnipegensis TaxID=2480810 RepID=A0A4Q8L8W2_9GAMM|nr:MULTISPECIES: DeoR/GlpR family DNA-binding transcription regulator [Pseudoxanthomonas]PZP62282.1 MAG: DeoR/GlpR transcriptional regulator [Pseudoxanthomonas spadix]TAA24532.1 DeoR/GlpR transcriptional regulator [Pseudoxanthomonas winnipegensis]TMN18395.1 DeoR/GlpR transcriptional regulator [Pseudoxanthomonas sp. X-1]UAY76068.1 DeoR/GlpR family DNA-binding transcription regulator [Pseudoxanthomonas sp. X-1]
MSEDTRFPAERAQTVLDLLREHGRVSSGDLAARFGVSEDSIRRDLRELASQGLCKRVYGGAVRTAPEALRFDQRLQHEASDKAGLAWGVCALLQPGSTVLLDAGTTNLAVAQRLPEHTDLTIVTNSPQIAIAAGERGGVQVQLIGGAFSPGAGGVRGAEALAQLQRLRVDVCLPGACALDPLTGVWATDAEEAALKRAMIAIGSRVIVVASPEKLGTEGRYHVAAPTEVDDLVIAAGTAQTHLQAFADAGIRVHALTR